MPRLLEANLYMRIDTTLIASRAFKLPAKDIEGILFEKILCYEDSHHLVFLSGVRRTKPGLLSTHEVHT